jgi:hypothetical protein
MLLTLSCLTLDGGEAKCRGEIEAIEVQKEEEEGIGGGARKVEGIDQGKDKCKGSQSARRGEGT